MSLLHRDEVQKDLESLAVEIKQALHAKRSLKRLLKLLSKPLTKKLSKFGKYNKNEVRLFISNMLSTYSLSFRSGIQICRNSRNKKKN